MTKNEKSQEERTECNEVREEVKWRRRRKEKEKELKTKDNGEYSKLDKRKE